MKNYIQSQKSNLFFLIGLLVYTGLNLFSAFTLELHFDEAYYWIYSQHPALGYFDHPPLISWMIFAGQALLDHELGVRLLSVVFSTVALLFLWKTIKTYAPDALLFWSLFYSFVLFHPFGFLATPDSPLLAFSILFFYFYRRLLCRISFQNIVLLAFLVGLMIYSKYHAFVLLFFVLLANYRIMRKPWFWMVVLLVLVYLLPHFFWQLEHHFPSLRYHLHDSHQTGYRPGVTLNYLLALFLLTGPWLGWLFLLILLKDKPDNEWEKALKYSGIGVIGFFFLATFAGDFEGHWILLSLIPLFVLSFKFLVQKPAWQKWVRISGLISFSVMLLIRIVALLPVKEKIVFLHAFSGYRDEASLIRQAADGCPVAFQDNWPAAARYGWYTRNRDVACLNSGQYRQTQFDLLNSDEKLTGQTVLVLTTDSTQFSEAIVLRTPRTKYYGKKIDDFVSNHDLRFTKPVVAQKEGYLSFQTTLVNPYEDSIRLGLLYGHPAFFALYQRNRGRWEQLSQWAVDSVLLAPLDTIALSGKLETDSIPSHAACFMMLKMDPLKALPPRFPINLSEKQ